MTVLLNNQPRGDVFAILRSDGDLLLKPDALQDMGLKQAAGSPVEIDGQQYVSLRSIAGLSFSFIEKTLTVELEADPRLLSTTTLDLSPQRNSGVLYPKDNSLFFNYGVNYHATDDSFTFADMNVSNELGFRFRDTLFLANTLYTENRDYARFLRLDTSMIRDDRKNMRRVVAGDLTASSGELGSQINMGGFSFSKIYRIDPYLIRTPLFNFSGLVSRPSEIDVYVNGVRIRSEQIAPGQFELRNLQAINGGQKIEVVIRDPYGREERYSFPFYFSDSILRKGLHEYSYNVGFVRRDYGVESNEYGDIAFSAYHRYGLSDSLNLGARAEGKGGLFNSGVQSALKLYDFGIVRAEAACSIDDDDSGFAGRVGYEYQSPRLQATVAMQGFSSGYRTLTDTADSPFRRKFNLFAGLGYTLPLVGSIGVQYVKSDLYHGSRSSDMSFSWTRQLTRQIFVNASYRRVMEPQPADEGSLFLTWSFAPGYSALASVQTIRETDSEAVAVRKDPPIGEGTGWSARAERVKSNDQERFTFNPTLQYNSPYGILRGDYTRTEGSGASTQDLLLGLSGSFVYLGNSFALSRPVTDSFAVVQVGELDGVRVYANGQTLGRTASDGKVVVPEMTSFYENQISIDDKDVPVDYLMRKVRLLVSPPYRSGSCLYFPLQKYEAFTGVIVLPGDDQVVPLANAEVTLKIPGGKVTFWTGENGEFYFDNGQAEMDLADVQGCSGLEEGTTPFLPAGLSPVSVHQGDRLFTGRLTIPKGEGTTRDLGEILLSLPSAQADRENRQPGEMANLPQSDSVDRTIPEKESIPDVSSPESKSQIRQDPISASPTPTPTPPEAGPSQATPEARPSSRSADIGGTAKESTGLPSGPTLAAAGLPTDPLEVHFPFDNVKLSSEKDRKVLDDVSRYLRDTASQVIIIGHTDQTGSHRYNVRLGMRRASAVATILKASGIDGMKIKKIMSYGKQKPKCTAANETCRARNRRAEIRIIEEQADQE